MKIGSEVRLSYKGTLEDGTIFGYALPDDPLVFKTGAGLVLDALEVEILQMNEIGEKRTVVLEPRQAYGEHSDYMMEKIPCAIIPPEQCVLGAKAFMDTNDETIVGVCVDITDGIATFDTNHPLAGKTLTFELELLGWDECEQEAQGDSLENIPVE